MAKSKVISVEAGGKVYTAVFTGSRYMSLKHGGKNKADIVEDNGDYWSIWFRNAGNDFTGIHLKKDKKGNRINKPFKVEIWGCKENKIIDEYEL